MKRTSWLLLSAMTCCTPAGSVAPSNDAASASSAPSASSASSAPATPAAPAHRDTGLRSYAPLENACHVDADCGLARPLNADSPSSSGCCVKCGEYVAGTAAWASSAKNACAAAGPCSLPSSCMEAETPGRIARCTAGHCVVVKN